MIDLFTSLLGTLGTLYLAYWLAVGILMWRAVKR